MRTANWLRRAQEKIKPGYAELEKRQYTVNTPFSTRTLKTGGRDVLPEGIPAPPAPKRTFARQQCQPDGTGVKPGLSLPRPLWPWTEQFRAGEPGAESAGKHGSQPYCYGCLGNCCRD